MCLAVPGKVLTLSGTDIDRCGRVSFGGAVREVNLSWVPEAQVGDYVMVHVGFAISVVEESEALQVFKYLEQMGAVAEVYAAGGPRSGDAE
jgi:hydrogenase expression/formation protein HypC